MPDVLEPIGRPSFCWEMRSSKVKYMLWSVALSSSPMSFLERWYVLLCSILLTVLSMASWISSRERTFDQRQFVREKATHNLPSQHPKHRSQDNYTRKRPRQSATVRSILHQKTQAGTELPWGMFWTQIPIRHLSHTLTRLPTFFIIILIIILTRSPTFYHATIH